MVRVRVEADSKFLLRKLDINYFKQLRINLHLRLSIIIIFIHLSANNSTNVLTNSGGRLPEKPLNSFDYTMLCII